MSESACASFGASPRVSSAIGAGAAGECRQEVSPVFAAPLFRTLPPHTEVIRTYLFLNFLQRCTKGYKVHFQSLLLSLGFLAYRIMELTSAWNLQCNDLIHKRRPKKHKNLNQ